MNQNNIVYILIDLFLKKNNIQQEILEENGFVPFWLQCNSNNFVVEDKNHIVLSHSILKRILFLYKLIKKNKKNIHHVEIYPGGRFAIIFLILCKIFSLKIICAERGDLLYFNKKGYGIFTKVSMYLVYKFSDITWYREPYMKELLDKIKVKKTFFFHNVTNSNESIKSNKFEIDFLWVNRLINERYSNWFVDAIQAPQLAKTNNLLIGIQNENNNTQVEYAMKNKPPNLELKSYSNPIEYYKKAKYFVLPTKIVFANNSLLEAMSFGVVPIVSNTKSTDLIVKDGINGFTFNTYEEFLSKLIEANNLDNEKYIYLSNNAKKTIQEEFSIDYFKKNILELYAMI